MSTNQQSRGLSGERLARTSHEASEEHHLAELTNSIDLGQKSSQQLTSALSHAVSSNAMDSAKDLLQTGVHHNGEMVIDAVKMGFVPMLELLRQYGWQIDDNIGGQTAITALNIACSHGIMTVTKYLLDSGANPDLGPAGVAWGSSGGDLYLNESRQWNLYHAAQVGSIEIVNLLLEYGAKDAAKGNLLHAAITSTSIPIIEYILSRGIDVNELDDPRKTGSSYGTPLHRVVASMFDPQLHMMRRSHAPMVLRNADISSNIEAVKVLLAHGADMNRVGKGRYRDQTVMHIIERDDAVNQIPAEIKELIRCAGAKQVVA